MSKPQGTCPVCKGTCRIPATGSYKHVTAGYDKESDTFPCRNCGGQTMWINPTGMVNLNSKGEPCTHEYRGVQAGRCYYEYTCTECGDRYSIDSSD